MALIPLKVIFPHMTSKQTPLTLFFYSRSTCPSATHKYKWMIYELKPKFLHSLCPPSGLLAANATETCYPPYVIYSYNGTTFLVFSAHKLGIIYEVPPPFTTTWGLTSQSLVRTEAVSFVSVFLSKSCSVSHINS